MSTAGVAIWGLICGGVSLAAAMFVTKRFSRPEVNWSIKVTVIICWWLSFSVVWLLPLDLIDTSGTTAVLWRIEFWGIQFLTWIWAGGQQDYFDAGDFTWRRKLRSSVIINCKILGVAGSIGIIFLIYVAVTNHMSKDDLTAFVIALANTVGLTLLILLLGHGLVEVPRKFWFEASMVIRMKHYLFKLKEVDVDYESAKEDMVKQLGVFAIVQRKVKPDDDLYPLVQEIASNLPDEQERKTSFGIMSLSSANYDDEPQHQKVSENEMTEDLLALVNFHAKRRTAEMRRVKQQFEFTVDKCIVFEEELLHMLEQQPPALDKVTMEGFVWLFTNQYGRRLLAMRLVAAFFALMTVFVLWCQCTMFTSANLSIFSSFVGSAKGSSVGLLITSTLPLAYICGCAFFSAFRLRIRGFYSLHDHQQTDANSMLYNAQLLLRLVVGIGYNYMIILRISGTPFLAIMGEMDVVPLFGSAFVLYFPLLTVFLCVATLLNLWQYVLKWLGVKTFQFNESKPGDIENEGMQLLETAKRRRKAGRASAKEEDHTLLESAAQTAAASTKKVLSFFGIGGGDEEAPAPTTSAQAAVGPVAATPKAGVKYDFKAAPAAAPAGDMAKFFA